MGTMGISDNYCHSLLSVHKFANNVYCFLTHMKTSPLEYAQKTELLYLIPTLQAALFAPMLALLAPASAADEPLSNACSPTYTLTDLGTLSVQVVQRGRY
jgi:hypothetical protein